MIPEDESNGESDGRVLVLLTAFIEKQQAIIRKCGLKPTWEVFTGSMAWFQIRDGLTEEGRDFLRDAWNAILAREDLYEAAEDILFGREEADN